MTERILKNAIHTLNVESSAILQLAEDLGDEFILSVQHLLDCKGRIIVTGIGKSALVAQKIVSTFNSTGAASIFLHAADAIHGDIGMLKSEDIALCLSKSGESPEIKILVPLLKRQKNKLIAITAQADSFLAKAADIVLLLPATEEACPFNLAPTTSTTAQLALGDALAVCLLQERGFTKNDFALNHPGGFIGKQLYLTVGELAAGNEVPRASENSTIIELINEISSKRLGATAILSTQEKLLGIVTDGDIRRMLNKHSDFQNLTAADIMTHTPKAVEAEVLAINARAIMQEYSITQLPVLKAGLYMGMIHLHDILREGIA